MSRDGICPWCVYLGKEVEVAPLVFGQTDGGTLLRGPSRQWLCADHARRFATDLIESEKLKAEQDKLLMEGKPVRVVYWGKNPYGNKCMNKEPCNKYSARGAILCEKHLKKLNLTERESR
jgi:hypothetical protein